MDGYVDDSATEEDNPTTDPRESPLLAEEEREERGSTIGSEFAHWYSQDEQHPSLLFGPSPAHTSEGKDLGTSSLPSLWGSSSSLSQSFLSPCAPSPLSLSSSHPAPLPPHLFVSSDRSDDLGIDGILNESPSLALEDSTGDTTSSLPLVLSRNPPNKQAIAKLGSFLLGDVPLDSTFLPQLAILSRVWDVSGPSAHRRYENLMTLLHTEIFDPLSFVRSLPKSVVTYLRSPHTFDGDSMEQFVRSLLLAEHFDVLKDISYYLRCLRKVGALRSFKFRHDFFILEPIGKGRFGSVVLARRTLDDLTCCIKCVEFEHRLLPDHCCHCSGAGGGEGRGGSFADDSMSCCWGIGGCLPTVPPHTLRGAAPSVHCLRGSASVHCPVSLWGVVGGEARAMAHVRSQHIVTMYTSWIEIQPPLFSLIPPSHHDEAFPSHNVFTDSSSDSPNRKGEEDGGRNQRAVVKPQRDVSNVSLSFRYCLYICMEYCAGGTLAAFLQKRLVVDRVLNIRILRGILKGVKAIHTAGLVHRDLKPSNIFFDHEGVIKIGDFGLSHMRDSHSLSHRLRGTHPYIAPESYHVGSTSSCDPAALDLYSVGVIALQLFSSSKAEGFSVAEAEAEMMRTCPELVDLVRLLISPTPSLRPSVVYCLKHPLFQ